MACKIDLRDMIAGEANAQGVPPEIALAVAAQESGICHWGIGGGVLRGKAGEYGVMQLMPATANGLGVDPTDVQDNIHGGVKYLRQLYDRYGDWTLAVQHYNGAGPAAQAYAARVMSIARGYGFGLALANNAAQTSAPAGFSPDVQTSATVTLPVVNAPVSKNLLIAVGIVAGAGVIALAIAG